MKNPDAQIVSALGTQLPQFQELARTLREKPSARPHVEEEMRQMLEMLTETNRLTLRKALMTVGIYPTALHYDMIRYLTSME